VTQPETSAVVDPATGRVAWFDVGPVEDFAEPRFRPVNIPGKDVWVLRTPDQRWYALKNSCPHRGAPLCRGTVKGTFVPSAPGEYVYGYEYRLIKCPHHGYEFDLETGRPLFTPGNDRVVRYDVQVGPADLHDVRIEQGRVYVSAKGR
jgi:phenylpropionate dioxygenase-like ring-hydroxylating dioxygenase large terminal subunit